MKRILAVLIAICSLALLSACRGATEESNLELIQKYETIGANAKEGQSDEQKKYYVNVTGGAKVENFGTKYGVELYDVEERDGVVEYYYAFSGEKGTVAGKGQYGDYIKYMETTFGKDADRTKASGMYSYKVADDVYIQLMSFNFSSEKMFMFSVVVPTDGVHGTDMELSTTVVSADTEK